MRVSAGSFAAPVFGFSKVTSCRVFLREYDWLSLDTGNTCQGQILFPELVTGLLYYRQ